MKLSSRDSTNLTQEGKRRIVKRHEKALEGGRPARPSGTVCLRLYRDEQLVLALEEENLFVNSGLPALAALLGGDTAGEFASAIGFGSGANAPSLGDTGLIAPVYYKALDSHSEDGAGSVTFNWSLTTAPTITKTWTASTAFSVGDTIAPGNGYYYKCTTAGTSGTSAPAFTIAAGSTTNDGTVVWTNQGVYDSGAIGITIQELGLFANKSSVALPGTAAPAPLLARKTISPISFASGMSLSGSWTLTF